jgi:hypothetical protein
MAAKIHMTLCLSKEYVFYVNSENSNLHEILRSDYYISQCANDYDKVDTFLGKLEIVPDITVTDFCK